MRHHSPLYPRHPKTPSCYSVCFDCLTCCFQNIYNRLFVSLTHCIKSEKERAAFSTLRRGKKMQKNNKLLCYSKLTTNSSAHSNSISLLLLLRVRISYPLRAFFCPLHQKPDIHKTEEKTSFQNICPVTITQPPRERFSHETICELGSLLFQR